MGNFTLILATTLAGSAAITEPTPGASGASLSANSFSWCSGTLVADLDRWGDESGIPVVSGWSYQHYNAHAAALRVDGSSIWSSNGASGTARLVTLSIAADPATASGEIVQMVPGVARIRTRVHGVEDAGCCSLAARVEVENVDGMAHSFEWRWLHDTAFGVYQVCPRPPIDPDVDGGEVCLPGEVPGSSCRILEFDALAAGAVGCGRSIGFRSADTGAAGPFYMFEDALNPPALVEVLSWEDLALEPALAWSGLVNGGSFAGCSGDNAILAGWRLPPGGGQLAPERVAALAWSIGQGCTPACCSVVADAGPPRQICEGQGVVLGGTPAALPGLPPYRYRWLPNDGSLNDPTSPNPIASPSTNTTYSLEIEDAAGCVARAEALVEVVPDLIPSDTGNTLLAVIAPGGAELSWQASSGASAYNILGEDDKRFSAPRRDALGVAGLSFSLAIDPAFSLRFLRVVGVSCAGREGP